MLLTVRQYDTSKSAVFVLFLCSNPNPRWFGRITEPFIKQSFDLLLKDSAVLKASFERLSDSIMNFCHLLAVLSFPSKSRHITLFSNIFLYSEFSI